MEILIVGYVIDIRKKLGKGEWVFAKINGTKAPTTSELIDRYGLFAQKGLIKLMVDFQTYVKECLETHSSLLDAVLNAVLIKPRPVKMAKKNKPKTDNVFTASNGMEFEITPELSNRFFKENPDQFKDFVGLFKVIPDGVLSSEEPQVTAFMDKAVPVYEKLVEEEMAEKAKKKEENKKKRKISRASSRQSKVQKTDDHPYEAGQGGRPSQGASLIDGKAVEDNDAE